MSRAAWLVGLGMALGAIAACADDPAPVDEATAPSAAPLDAPLFERSLPQGAHAQAEQAVRLEQARRDERFIEAVDPGALFRTTRLDQAAIDAGSLGTGELYEAGARLFHATFTKELGFGARDRDAVRRFHEGRAGGPDARRCATCHWRGGPAGAGDGADLAYLDGDGDRQSSALARNAIALHGAGFVELLAKEMTAELQASRYRAVAVARSTGKDARVDLIAKGVSFGELVARPDGTLDVTKLAGVDADLVVKPFGHKGNFVDLRDVVEDSLLVHHGMQSTHLARAADPARVGAFGGDDPDGDGVRDEITEGQVTALTAFVALQEVPAIEPAEPQFRALYDKGEIAFRELGCASCHVASLPLESATWSLPSRDGGAPLVIDLEKEGAEPRVARQRGELRVWLFSDLKRHDVGPELAEARADRGVAPNLFLTRPLWGLARSRPYLHDGRTSRVEEAILLHGGEAKATRDAFAALGEVERAPLRVYLQGLTRARRMVAP